MFKEKIGSFGKSNNTTAILADSVVRLGGQYRRVKGSLSTMVSGLGGLDSLDSPAELIKNGNFDYDLSNWTFPGGTTGITWGAGTMIMAVSSARAAEQVIVTVPGVTYQFTCNYNNVTNSTGPTSGAYAAAYTASNATGTLLNQFFNTPGTGPGTISFTFVATTTTSYIFLSTQDGADAVTYDNVSVKSVNPTIAPAQTYYTYAVISGGVVGLVCTLSNIKPPSFSSYKKIGVIFTDISGNVARAYRTGHTQWVSSIRLSSANGYGSTGTKVVKWAHLVHQIGDGINWNSDTVNGDSLVANLPGIYSWRIALNTGASSWDGGVSRNAPTTTNFVSLPIENRATSISLFTVADDVSSVSGSFYANAGDVLRVQSQGAALNATQDSLYSEFVLSYQAPNIDWTDY